MSDDAFVLGSDGGRIDAREGAHRGPPWCCCAGIPGPRHSCHVRNNNEPNSRVAVQVDGSVVQKRAKTSRFLRGSEAAAAA